MKKNLNEKDYPKLRDHFLNVFIKGTYKKRSLYETYGYGMFGTLGDGSDPRPTQPRVRKRFLAEEGYGGKYQPGTIHKATEPHRFDFMVIGRYFTKNLGHENYRLRVINLDKGKIDYVGV